MKPPELPTVEMPALRYPPRAERKCGWCGISLAALPDCDPLPYQRPGRTSIEYFHHGCITAQRNEDAMIPPAL